MMVARAIPMRMAIIIVTTTITSAELKVDPMML